MPMLFQEGSCASDFACFYWGVNKNSQKQKNGADMLGIGIFMGVTKISQICKNMELRENQEWTNRNKTTRKKAEWYRGTATGVISDISDFERQPRIIKK